MVSPTSLPTDLTTASTGHVGHSNTTHAAVNAVTATAYGLNEMTVAFARFATRDVAAVPVVALGSSTAGGQGATNEARSIMNRLVNGWQFDFPLSSGAAQTQYGVALASSMSLPVGIQLIKAATSGAQSSDYLTTTKVSQIGAINPAVLIHMIGSNDYSVNVNPATYKTNVLGWLDALDAAITVPHVHVLVHGHRRMNNSNATYAWSQYGVQIKALAEAREGAVFVDLSMAYAAAGQDGTDPLGFMDPDRIHMTDKGHTFGADLLRGYLRPAAIQAVPFTPLPDGAVANPALVISTSPAISGTAVTGETVTVSNGTWSATPDSYTYQWRRAGVAISGATAATYVLVVADENQAITAAVTASKSGYTSATAVSSPITPAAAGSLVLTNSTAPTITGTTTTGSVLTATNGTWSATPDSYTYQWKRAGANISGATAQTYTLVSGDVGQAITVTVTAVKAGYTSGSATSASVTPTAPPSGITETWTGTDGAAWPAQWTTTGSGASSTIVGNRGRITTAAGSYVYGRGYLSGMTAQSDTDLTVEFQPVVFAAESIVFIAINAGSTEYFTPDNGYVVSVNYTASGTGQSWRLRKRTGGSNLDIQNASIALSDAPWKVRLQRAGSVVQAKLWLASAAEPGSWAFSYTDSTPLAANKIHLAFQNAGTGSRSCDFDNLSAV